MKYKQYTGKLFGIIMITMKLNDISIKINNVWAHLKGLEILTA